MWDAVEADFQRDYGIDLVEQIDRMSWRRFKTLLANVSPFGAIAGKAEELRSKPDSDEESDRAQADAFFSSMLYK